MPNYTVQYPSQKFLFRDLNADSDCQEYKHMSNFPHISYSNILEYF